MFARGAFLHYTSPRFLREAKSDAEQITNHFNRAFASLIAARNQESKEMHKRLMLVQEEKQAADNALAVAKEAVRNAARDAEGVRRERDLQAEEIEAQRLELQALKAKLRLAEKKNTQE
jgi:hypothetical protein